MTAVDSLLQTYRQSAVSEREKGTYFERLARAYLTTDPVQVEEYSSVWNWADWAREQRWSGQDTLTTLSSETGLHRNTVRGLLAASRVTPFAPDRQEFGPVYLRAEALRALKSG